MGEEISDGTGRLSLIDFTGRIVVCNNHHWLRNKYVCKKYVAFLLIALIRQLVALIHRLEGKVMTQKHDVTKRWWRP